MNVWVRLRRWFQKHFLGYVDPGVYVDAYVVAAPEGELVPEVHFPVPFFIGLFPQGPMGEVVRIGSVAELERTFGPVTAPPSVSADIYAFFRDGGGKADVMRVATVAEITIEDGFVRVPIGDNVAEKRFLRMLAEAPTFQADVLKKED